MMESQTLLGYLSCSTTADPLKPGNVAVLHRQAGPTSDWD